MTGSSSDSDKPGPGGDAAERLRQHLRARFSEEEVADMMRVAEGGSKDDEGRSEKPEPEPPEEAQAEPEGDGRADA